MLLDSVCGINYNEYILIENGVIQIERNKTGNAEKATREKILHVAANQFASRGFSVATTDIAKEAGISHGSIFVHFPNRENLIDTVIQQFFEGLNMQIHMAVKGQKSITDVLNKHLDILQANEAFYKTLVAEMAFLPAHTQEQLFGYQSTLSFHFQAVLEAEQAQGNIKAIPQYMLFNTWMAILHYYLVNSRMFQPEGSVIEGYRQELLTTYLKLIERTDER